MLARGTVLKQNEIAHLDDGTTKIFAFYKEQPMEVLIDSTDWPQLRQYSWYVEKGKGTYYASTRTGSWDKTRNQSRSTRMHRVLFPDSIQVDHKDHNGLNNRRENLRPVTNQQNCMNRTKTKKPTTSTFMGVCRDIRKPGRWQSGIMLNGKRRSLGRFDSEAEAAVVRDVEALDLFGEHAKLNFSKNLIVAYKETRDYLKTYSLLHPNQPV